MHSWVFLFLTRWYTIVRCMQLSEADSGYTRYYLYKNLCGFNCFINISESYMDCNWHPLLTETNTANSISKVRLNSTLVSCTFRPNRLSAYGKKAYQWFFLSIYITKNWDYRFLFFLCFFFCAFFVWPKKSA